MKEWIWIAKWEDFQHYEPERDRPPAWIKDYPKQLRDDRYLALTDRQRALLRDLRDVFAVTFGRVPGNTRAITRHRHAHTYRRDLEALNDAGFIEFVSRESLERRLEHFYSLRKKKREKKKEIPLTPAEQGNDSEPVRLNPRALGTNPRAVAAEQKRQSSFRDFVARSWDEYPDLEVLVDELVDRGLEATGAWELINEEQERRSEEVEAA